MNGGGPSCGSLCDPEGIFELVDGQAAGERARSVRGHLQGCVGCREIYEREVRLNERLGHFDATPAPGRSVHRMVAMALPTRTARSRVAWALLAAALSLSALFALEASGRSPAILFLDVTAWVSGAAAGAWDVGGLLFAAVGRWLVLGLLVGLVIDVALAVVVVAILARGRRRTSEA